MGDLKKGSGPLSAPLWIIGDSPAKNESEGIFTNTVNQKLVHTLQSVGVKDKEMRFDVISYQTGRFQYIPEKDIQQNLARVKASIKESEPNLILLVGNKPLQYLGKRKNVMNWRGHVFWNEELECKMMCIIAPDTVNRQQWVHKTQKPGQYQALFVHDVYRVLEEMKTPEVTQAELHPVTKPTFVEAESFLEEMLENANILSYDIETLKPYDACFIDCIGFASDLDHGICIPFYTPTKKGFSRVYSWEETVRLWQLVKQLMESQIPKVAQNSIFDTGVLEHWYGIKTVNLAWDTLVLAHNLYCDLPKDMGTLITLYTNLPYHKFMIHEGIEQRWIYNAIDAIGNLHILKGELEEAKELCILDHYQNHTHPCIRTSVEMHLQGVPVDEEVRDRALTKEHAIMEQLLETFDKILPFKLDTKKSEHKFNPNSSPQKKELFLEILKCKGGKRNYQGKVSMDKHRMGELAKEGKNQVVKVLAEACIEYKRASVMAGKLKTPTYKGKLFTQQNPAGTDTGRWNSKKSEILPGGTNLQNLEKGLQRQIIIAPKGRNLWEN